MLTSIRLASINRENRSGKPVQNHRVHLHHDVFINGKKFKNNSGQFDNLVLVGDVKDEMDEVFSHLLELMPQAGSLSSTIFSNCYLNHGTVVSIIFN